MTPRNALVLLLALLVPALSARALEFGPVVIDVGEVISTGATYGYSEIPLRVENTSDQDVTVTLMANTRPEMYSSAITISRFTRTFHAPAGAEMTVLLQQPAMTIGSDRAVVLINGQPQRSALPLPTSAHISGNSAYWAGRQEHHAVLTDLAISAVTRDTIGATVTALSSLKSSYYGDPYVAHAHHTDVWPETWLGYTRFLVVAVSVSRWDTLEPTRKRAMLDYAAAGGMLVFVGAEQPRDLEADFTTTEQIRLDWHGLSAQSLGHGTVYTVPESLELDRWTDVIQAAERTARWRTPSRRLSNDIESLPMTEHLELPVRSLLALLVVFGVLIGPVNVLALTMLRRPVLLFITTPLLGVCFAAGVFAFGFLADGVKPSARSATLVVLDQQRQQAVSATLAAYYAPLTPGDGVAFSPTACVMPSTDSDSFRSSYRPSIVSLALTGAEQRFTSGLIRARMPSYIRLLNVETRRERVLIEHTAEGVVALNGFASEIDSLWYADESGAVYTGGPIAAGAQAALTPYDGPRPPTVGEWNSIAGLLKEAPRGGLVNHVMRDRDLVPKKVPRSGYVAHLRSPAFFEPGLENLKTHDADTLIVGTLAREGGAPRAR